MVSPVAKQFPITWCKLHHCRTFTVEIYHNALDRWTDRYQ